MALLRGGYSPIPCEGKRPVLKAWEKHVATNADEIRLLVQGLSDAENTGALTRLMPTIDIDIKNPEAAAAIEDLARERFEERGYFLVRIGEAPKRAIVLRTDQPFAEDHRQPHRAGRGATEKIEVLATASKSSCSGIHPGTGKPYAGMAASRATSHGKICPMCATRTRSRSSRRPVRCWSRILATSAQTSGRGRKGAMAARRRRRRAKARKDDDPEPVDRDKIEAALAVIGSGSYDTWLHVGAALHHELGESGFEMFDAWSARSRKYTTRRMQKEMVRSSGYYGDHRRNDLPSRRPGRPWLASVRQRWAPADERQAARARADQSRAIRHRADPAARMGRREPFPEAQRRSAVRSRRRRQKPLLLQLAVAHVLGKDWLRSLPEKGPVLLVNCEDDEGELVRRLQPILKHYGASYADVAPDLHIFSLVDRDDETGQLLATVGRDGIVAADAAL